MSDPWQRIQIAVFDKRGGTLLADWSGRIVGLNWREAEHGAEQLRGRVPMELEEAYSWYDYPGVPWVEVNEGGETTWAGRLEEIAVGGDGINITAYGGWRALSDTEVTALWSTTDVSAWRPMLETEGTGGRRPKKYDFDTDKRLLISPTKGTTYANTTDFGSLAYEVTHGSERLVTAVSFDWELLMPNNWVGRLVVQQPGFGAEVTIWSETANGLVRSGPASYIFGGSPKGVLEFSLYNNTGGNYTYNNENGDFYLKITNLRIKTTTSTAVYADEIARALVASVAAVNPNQLSSSTALIQSPVLDLRDELYEDERPADILNHLAILGDNQTPPRRWRAWVDIEQRLGFAPWGDGARTWYVDVAGTLAVQRNLDELANSVRAIYEDASGRTVRSAYATDAQSMARFGLTRQASVSVKTTNASQAAVRRDMVLADRANPRPQSGITVDVLFDERGDAYSVTAARVGDRVVVRNIDPTLSVEIDRISTFTIAEIGYTSASDEAELVPEAPLTRLDVLLAREAEGIR